MTAGTYEAPEHGWTCFHCGETFAPTFAGQRDARTHFGPHPDEEPGCVMQLGPEDKRILARLRRAEEELARYRAEDSDKDRQMAAMACDHGAALRSEEEKGYARGLRDSREIIVSLIAVVPKYQKPTLDRAREFIGENVEANPVLGRRASGGDCKPLPYRGR